MTNLFSDGKFNTIVTNFVDIVIVNLLWFVCCIPIVTVGASTSAAYHTLNKCVRNGEGKLTREFFGAFKNNFKQATLVGLLALVIEGITYANYRITLMQYEAGLSPVKMYYVMMALMAFFIIWFISACAYITKFNNTLKQVLTNSILMFTRSLINTLLVIAVMLAAIVILWCYIRLIIVIPAFMLYFVGRFFNNIYDICIEESADS